MEMAQITAVQVLVMFLLMAVGYICRRIGMITEAGSAEMNRLLIMGVAPAVIINSYNSPFDAELFRQICDGFLLAVIAHVIALALAFIFIRGKDEKSRIDRFGTLLSNSGFMGIPLITATLGAEGVVFASAYLAVFNIFQWSVGSILLAGRSDPATMAKKILLNPGIIAIVIGLAIFLLSIPVPKPISQTVSYVGSMNTPLAMILVGTYMARTNMKEVFSSLRVYRVCILRLIAVGLLINGINETYGIQVK